MRSFDLSVASEKFSKVGVRPCFDESKYAELMDFLTDQMPDENMALSVEITPAQAWRLSPSKTRDYLLAGAYGNYKPRRKAIKVYCVPDIANTNKTLLHETKHWGDDMGGLLGQETKVRLHKLEASVGSTAVIGAISGLAVAQIAPMEVATIAGGLTFIASGLPLALQTLYIDPPAESRAKEFISNPDILQEYGRILTYKQI